MFWLGFICGALAVIVIFGLWFLWAASNGDLGI